jgi:hypothetical protein
MQKIISSIVLGLALLGVVSCAHRPKQQEADPTEIHFVPVAIIDPAQKDHVQEILRLASIQSFCEGSLGYAVMVPRDTAARAKALLQKETAGEKWIMFP